MAHSPSKQAKLNPTIARALAALESDDDGGKDDSNRNSDGESKEGQQYLLEQGISSHHAHQPPVVQNGNIHKSSSRTGLVETTASDCADCRNSGGASRTSEADSADNVAGAYYAHAQIEGADANNVEVVDTAERDDITTVVRPHSSDILPCFLSTPFDREEMLALHRLKEGIEPVDRKRNRSMVIDRLPISPQKNFFKKNKVVGDTDGNDNSSFAGGSDVKLDSTSDAPSNDFANTTSESASTGRHHSEQHSIVHSNTLPPPHHPTQSQSNIQLPIITQQPVSDSVKYSTVHSNTLPPPHHSLQSQSSIQSPIITYQPVSHSVQHSTVHSNTLPPPHRSLQSQSSIQSPIITYQQVSHSVQHSTVHSNTLPPPHHPTQSQSNIQLPIITQQPVNCASVSSTIPQQSAWLGQFPQQLALLQPSQYTPSQQMPLLSQISHGHLLNAFVRIQNYYSHPIVHASNTSELRHPHHSAGAISMTLSERNAQDHSKNENIQSSMINAGSLTSRQKERSSLMDHPSSQPEFVEAGQSLPSSNDPIVVRSGKVVKLTSGNRYQIAKLPVAFGFSLGDGGASQALALAATRNWYNNGKQNAIVEGKGIGNVRKEWKSEKKSKPRDKISDKKHVDTSKRRNGATSKGKEDKRGRPTIGKEQTGKKTPTSSEKSKKLSSNNGKNKVKTSPSTSSAKGNSSNNNGKLSASPRNAALLVASSNAPPGLPDGWTTKTFQRMSGKTSGSTDMYWYSPLHKYKFRSMRACTTFLAILKEPDIGGDETMALSTFKKRGFRL